MRARLNDHVFRISIDYHTSEVLECARAFKRRRIRIQNDHVFRISIDYILELLARFARSPTTSRNLLNGVTISDGSNIQMFSDMKTKPCGYITGGLTRTATTL